jgi:hypothetical protein
VIASASVHDNNRVFRCMSSPFGCAEQPLG